MLNTRTSHCLGNYFAFKYQFVSLYPYEGNNFIIVSNFFACQCPLYIMGVGIKGKPHIWVGFPSQVNKSL